VTLETRNEVPIAAALAGLAFVSVNEAKMVLHKGCPRELYPDDVQFSAELKVVLPHGWMCIEGIAWGYCTKLRVESSLFPLEVHLNVDMMIEEYKLSNFSIWTEVFTRKTDALSYDLAFEVT
jgi:hypothetical protein